MNMSIENCLKLLPKRYHEEFTKEVIVDQTSLDYLSDVFEYYLADIFNELSEKEKEPIYKEFLIIELP